MTTIIEKMIALGIPVIVEQSNEERGEYAFASLSEEQQYQINKIFGGWNAIKVQRNILLSESDWTQMADAPLTIGEKLLWSEYRQALRDIPQTFANPEDVIFPEKPS